VTKRKRPHWYNTQTIARISMYTRAPQHGQVLYRLSEAKEQETLGECLKEQGLALVRFVENGYLYVSNMSKRIFRSVIALSNATGCLRGYRQSFLPPYC
jgi:hypothetical protein